MVRRAGPADPHGMTSTENPTARAPEELLVHLADTFNRRDGAGHAALFDEDAVFVAPPAGEEERGVDAIRAGFARLMDLDLRLSIEVDRTIEGERLALTHTHWTLEGSGFDRRSGDLHGRGTVVSRRQADGTWRIVIENPLTPS
jgi:uncharacterized protein (TIGR02246 family)